MAQWYYTQNGQQAGPVDESQLRAMLSGGQVGPAEMVWKDGMAAWQPASAVPELAGAGAAPAPTYPAPQYGQPQPQYGAPQYGQPQYGQPQYGAPINYAGAGPDQYGKALTSFIVSLCGLLCLGPILGIVAIVFGILALNGMKQSGNPRGKGLAMAGLIIGIIDIPLSIIIGIAYVASQHSM